VIAALLLIAVCDRHHTWVMDTIRVRPYTYPSSFDSFIKRLMSVMASSITLHSLII